MFFQRHCFAPARAGFSTAMQQINDSFPASPRIADAGKLRCGVTYALAIVVFVVTVVVACCMPDCIVGIATPDGCRLSGTALCLVKRLLLCSLKPCSLRKAG